MSTQTLQQQQNDFFPLNYSTMVPTTADVKICRYGAHVLLHDKKYTKTIAHNYRNSASQLLGNSASISRHNVIVT